MKTIKRKGLRRIILIGVILLTILGMVASISFAQTEKIPRGGTLKMIREEFPHLNSAIASGFGIIIPGCQIFAGLLLLDENLQPQPYLAKKWEISPDGRTYTFYLEEKATFHDGKPITSADVAFSLELVKKYNPSGESLFGSVERVETPNPHTAVFKLKHPSPVTFIATHPAGLPILPRHIYGEGEIRTHPANVKPIGSGPFKFVEWKKGQYILLERYENYFRPGKPYLDRIIVEFVPDISARTIALETGSVHLIPFGYVNYDDYRRLEKMPHLAITKRGVEAIGMRNLIDMNLRKPPLSNINVRKAIAHAVNKDTIIENQGGFGKPATSHLRYTSLFHNPKVKQYEYNLSKANQLLDEAGYKRGPDGTRFELTMDLWPGSPVIQAACESLREELKKVGIKLTIRPSPDVATYFKRISGWDYEMNYNVIPDGSDPAIGFERLYTSKNIKKLYLANTMGYSNPEVDRLCDEARMEQNFEKRKKLYHRVQEILADELPTIAVTDHEQPTIYNKEFDGFPMDRYGIINPLDTVFWRKGKVGP